MIKKDSRPIRLATQNLKVKPNIKLPFLIPFRLLRSIHKMLHSRGFVALSTFHTFFPQLEGYDMGGYLTKVEAVYVGKRKCKDALLRRRLRGVTLERRNLVIEGLL